MAGFQRQKLSDRVHENPWIAKLKSIHLEINSVGRIGPFSTSQSTERSYARKERMEWSESRQTLLSPPRGAERKRGKREERKTAHMYDKSAHITYTCTEIGSTSNLFCVVFPGSTILASARTTRSIFISSNVYQIMIKYKLDLKIIWS